jgi:hypothetical protein
MANSPLVATGDRAAHLGFRRKYNDSVIENVYSEEYTEASNVFFAQFPMGVISSTSYGHWQIAVRIVYTDTGRWNDVSTQV